MKKQLCFVAIGMALASAIPAWASKETLAVTISTQADRNYRREMQQDGKLRPESYVLADGGIFPGTTRDESFAYVSYPEVAGKVGQHLAAQNYRLAQKAREADLFIVVFWGQTIPFDNGSYDRAVSVAAQTFNDVLANRVKPISVADRLLHHTPDEEFDPTTTGGMEFAMAQIEMENHHRDQANLENARLLGYVDAINDRRDMMAWADVGGLAQELVDDVEEPRYYIVVGAYDFQAMLKERKKVLRWVTRISIGSRGTSFDERMAQMVASAAGSFGQGYSFRRRHFGDPSVELGETKFLGVIGGPALEPVDPAAKK